MDTLPGVEVGDDAATGGELVEHCFELGEGEELVGVDFLLEVDGGFGGLFEDAVFAGGGEVVFDGAEEGD